MLRLPVPQAETESRFNIAPSQLCRTVVSSDRAERGWSEQAWGLPGAKGIHINARSETVAELPRFRDLFADPRSRCLVPADGYFEWRKEGKIRQPYYFTLQDQRPFCFAGLAEQAPSGPSFLILTTAANESTQNVHHRMPVILPEEQYNRWLLGEADEATEALEAKASPTFSQRAVGQRVNRVEYDDEACIAEGRTQSVLFDF